MKWTPKMDSLLGTAIDRLVAKSLGIPKYQVRDRRKKLGVSFFSRWTPELDVLLGTVPDQEVADLLGISVPAVYYRRKKLNVSAFQPHIEVTWTPEMDALLGTKMDKEISRELGLPTFVVRYRRDMSNIPSWQSQQPLLEGTRYQQEQRLPDTFTYAQWKHAVEYFDNCCAYCGKRCFLTEDHLVPVSKGGSRTVLNIIPACSSCNSSKHVKQAHLWIYEHFGMERGKEIISAIVEYLREVKK